MGAFYAIHPGLMDHSIPFRSLDGEKRKRWQSLIEDGLSNQIKLKECKAIFLELSELANTLI